MKSSDETPITNPCTPVDGPQCPDLVECDGDCQRPSRHSMADYRERVAAFKAAQAADPDGAPDPLDERKEWVETRGRAAWDKELEYRRGR